MKKYILFLLIAIGVVSFSSCSGGGTTIYGKLSVLKHEAKNVYLCDAYSYKTIDSTRVNDGKFVFHIPDSVKGIRLLALKNALEEDLPLPLPVVVGEGNVNVIMGETILTYGTPLNDRLQDFLLATDAFHTEMLEKELSAAEIAPLFTSLLQEQILLNRDNIVGVYIYKSYKSRFSPEKKEELIRQCGEWFGKQIK